MLPLLDIAIGIVTALATTLMAALMYLEHRRIRRNETVQKPLAALTLSSGFGGTVLLFDVAREDSGRWLISAVAAAPWWRPSICRMIPAGYDDFNQETLAPDRRWRRHIRFAEPAASVAVYLRPGSSGLRRFSVTMCSAASHTYTSSLEIRRSMNML